MTADAAAAELAAAPFGADRARTAGEALCDDVPPARAEALLQHGPRRARGRGRPLDARPHRHASPVAVPVFVLAADDEMGSAFPARHAERLAIATPTWRSSASPAPATASTTSATTAATTSTRSRASSNTHA